MYAIYGIVLLVVALVLAFVINPFVAIGIFVVGGVAVVLIGSGKALREPRVSAGPAPSGVPTTRETGYEPVSEQRAWPST